VSIFPFP
jgi:cytochrome P450